MEDQAVGVAMEAAAIRTAVAALAVAAAWGRGAMVTAAPATVPAAVGVKVRWEGFKAKAANHPPAMVLRPVGGNLSLTKDHQSSVPQAVVLSLQ